MTGRDGGMTMRLYAILLSIFSIIFFAVSCGNTYAQKSKKESIGIKNERLFSSGNLIIEKVKIEGHEYLLFYGRLATSPSVIHNENCPCKILNSTN